MLSTFCALSAAQIPESPLRRPRRFTQPGWYPHSRTGRRPQARVSFAVGGVETARPRIGGLPVSKLDPAQTIIVLPKGISWRVPAQAPADSVAEAVLGGGEDQDGAYLRG
jgi:hypothetical protein